MRLYVPATSTDLHALAAAGHLAAPVDAVAVTPALRDWCGEDDEEELEFVAAAEAELASLHRLAADPSAARRRVVLAVDVADGDVEVRDDPAPGAVVVGRDVPLARVASVHVDDADAEPVVAAAADALTAAEAGDADAQARVDAADEHALSWFANQELDDLLRDLVRGA